MNIVEVGKRSEELVDQLLVVWESAVRATHHFLNEEEILKIREYVPEAIKGIPHLVIAEKEDGTPVAFMGIADGVLEMLFIHNAERGKGLGRKLLTYGIENYGVTQLSVNEQNPSAKGFYEHMGFTVYKRTELDEQGNPYPILFMKR